MRKLISNDITVSEQMVVRDQFLKLVQNWQGHWQTTDIHLLLLASGVKCQYVSKYTCNLSGFEVVDEKKYLFFVLEWS